MKGMILILGTIVAFLAAAFFVPGLDILAWYFLQPVNFWQRMILIAVEGFTLVPRGALGITVFGIIETVVIAFAE